MKSGLETNVSEFRPILTSSYSTGSQRPHRCCPLVNNVEIVDRGRARAAAL